MALKTPKRYVFRHQKTPKCARDSISFQVCLGCLKAFKGYLKGVSKGCSMGVSKVLWIYFMAVLSSLHGYLGKVSKPSLRGDLKIAPLPPQENQGFVQFGPFWDFFKNLFRTLPRVIENVLTPLKTLQMIWTPLKIPRMVYPPPPS